MILAFVICKYLTEVNLWITEARFETTSTGIDVTGTVTADGLIVSGDSTIGGSSATTNVLLDLVEPTSTSDVILGLKANSSNRTQLRTTQGLGTSSDFRLLTVDSGSTKERFKIDSGGDISFYEDTGTTAKLVWKSADERLGIGTSSPSVPLEVEGSVKFGSAATGVSFAIQSTDEYRINGIDIDGNGFNSLHFRADGTDGLFIEKDTNNVGIGTSSPANGAKLQQQVLLLPQKLHSALLTLTTLALTLSQQRR